jgi:acyl-CoA-binding protein
MNKEELDILFQKAVKSASKMSQASLPQDVQLRLYAYYKQATYGSLNYNQADRSDLRNAFKINAWIQISNISISKAKEKYIEIINSLQE